MSISGLSSSMYMAADSMSVHTVGTQVASHNIANISTDGFTPQRATYATGSNGMGVELENVRKLEQPWGGDTASISSEALDLSVRKTPSGTEIAREVPQLIRNQRGFEANAATIRTTDEMMGSLLNIIG